MSVSQTPSDCSYWVNGEEFDGIRNQLTLTGSEKYWIEGIPARDLFPLNNIDTSKMLLIFEF